EPKTITGNAPKPKPQVEQPVPLVPSASDEAIRAQNAQALAHPPPIAPAEAKLYTPVDTLKAEKGDTVDPVALYRYLLGKFSNSELVRNHYVPPDGDYWGIKTGSAAEWAAFALAVAKQESDFDTRSTNLRDPGGSYGLFQFSQKYNQQFTRGGDQYNPQASADAFVRAVEYYLGNKGRVANMGKIFGSILRPNEAGQYIAGAQKVAAGGSGKDLVSSGGGEKSQKVSSSDTAPVPQPQISLPGGGGGGGQPQAPSGGGYSGGGAASTGRGAREGGSSEAGSVSFYPGGFGGGGGSGGGDGAPPQKQPTKTAPPPEAEEDPMVASLMKRGFTKQEAINFAQGSQAITPGKGVPPYQKPPAPPAPGQVPLSTTPQLLSPKLLTPKQLGVGKVPKIVSPKGPPPAAPGKQPQLPAPSGTTI